MNLKVSPKGEGFRPIVETIKKLHGRFRCPDSNQERCEAEKMD
jgi:hypothetical protein